MRVGLTGGIGSGKSEVGKVFAECGALLIDADELAREAVAPGSEGLRRIAEQWPSVTEADGSLDRTALAALIFADPAARADVNAIVHPIVRRLGNERESGAAPGQIAVREVPLLFETDFDRECDATVLVVAPREARIARVMNRSGLSRDEVERRMAAQIDPEAARTRATYTIDNDGSLDDLQDQARSVWSMLRNAAGRNE